MNEWLSSTFQKVITSNPFKTTSKSENSMEAPNQGDAQAEEVVVQKTVISTCEEVTPILSSVITNIKHPYGDLLNQVASNFIQSTQKALQEKSISDLCALHFLFEVELLIDRNTCRISYFNTIITNIPT